MNSPLETTEAALIDALVAAAEAICAPGETVAAVLPAEPAIGVVAVVCWAAGEEQRFGVIDSTGVQHVDKTAVRETFALVAMDEALREACDGDAGAETVRDLDTWLAGGDAPDPVCTGLGQLIEALGAVHESAATDGLHVRRPQALDEIGQRLRELDAVWQSVAPAVESWAGEVAHSEPVELQRIEALWQILAGVVRGPLAAPASVVVQRGRSAGLALADEILRRS